MVDTEEVNDLADASQSPPLGLLQALGTAFQDEQTDQQEATDLERWRAPDSFDRYRIYESLQAMGQWIAARCEWDSDQLRSALRCNLAPSLDSVVELPVSRLQKCEDFFLSICRDIAEVERSRGSALDVASAHRVVFLASDLFMMSGWQSTVSKVVATSTESRSSAFQAVAENHIAHAYSLAVPHPALLRRPPSNWRLSNHLTAMEKQTSRVFTDRLNWHSQRLSVGIGSHIRSLLSGEIAEYLVEAISQVATDDSALSAWDIVSDSATFHNELLMIGTDPMECRAAAMALAINQGVYFDVRRPPLAAAKGSNTAGRPLVSQAYDQLLHKADELPSVTPPIRDFALSCVFRASAELWRYEMILENR